MEAKRLQKFHPLRAWIRCLWPTPLILPQSETERLLLAFLEKQGVSVARNAECVEVQTTIGGVTCKLKHAYGATETIELIGWQAVMEPAASFDIHCQ